MLASSLALLYVGNTEMAQDDNHLFGNDPETRRRRLIGPYADDPAFDPYYASDIRDRADDARFDPVDPDYDGYTEYGRDHEDREPVDWAGAVREQTEARERDASAPPPDDPDDIAEDTRRPGRGWWFWLKWALYGFLAFFFILIAWLIIAAPVSRTAQPTVPPEIVLTAADGTPIARSGPIMDRPVTMDELPPYVAQAFMAIEDRRFEEHWGIDPRGIGRALWSNMTSDSVQGGSTITQQLVKITYLDSERTLFRKIQEVPISLWLELWLSKDQIMERYLSNVYFGDNVYGLRAASLHYFYRHPENLTLSQATMLAGLVKAPSRLAPTNNLEGAQERQRVVIAAMVDAGYLTEAEGAAVPLAEVDHRPREDMPRGGYFADWAMDEARDVLPAGYETVEVQTTLDWELQQLAERAARNGTPAGAQVALVAMRTNGDVVAMVGGRDYATSAFNRATQAERQPGSTFKIIVYFAALQSGMTPETIVNDTPIETGDYRPSNSGGTYRGRITLREAFARSSNVVAVRLYQQLGPEAIAEAARTLGLERELPTNPAVALGSAEMTLLELTSVYASIAGGYSPVSPHAIPQEEAGFFGSLFSGPSRVPSRQREQMLDLLNAAVDGGTGNAARLAIPAYGKTGTTQNSRDALFVGFAGDLVVGVWIGNDDNTPLGSASGGGAPARIWRQFMAGAIQGAAPAPTPRRPERREVEPAIEPEEPAIEKPVVTFDEDGNVIVETPVGGGRIGIDGNGLTVEPDRETRRRLDELERVGEDIERRTEDARRAVEDATR